MKKMRRFAAIAAAAAMTACMAVPMMSMMTASAVNVTINETETGHSYSAYQIFAGTLTDGALTGITWGNGVDTTKVVGEKTLIQALNALDITGFDGLTDAASVANAISALNDGSVTTYGDLDKVADVFAEYLSSTSIDSAYTTAYNIPITAAGYYLIVDGKAATSTGYESASKYLLNIVDPNETSVSVNVKKDAPTVMKKIKENAYADTTPTFDSVAYSGDVGYNDTADYCIGDAVPFKLYGSLPSTLDNYQGGYKYVFHDTLDSQFDAPQDIVVKVGDYYVKKVTDATDKTGYYHDTEGDNCSFDIAFADIKSVLLYTDAACTTTANATVGADDHVTVEYTAVLNATATPGRPGQQNEVYLTYSSNSNDSSETTDTAKDNVIAFTYELDLTKVDSVDTDKELSGASFVLTRTVGTATQYAVLDVNSKIVDWVTTTGTVKVDTDNGTLTLSEGAAWTSVYNLTSVGTPTVTTTEAAGTFKYVGLDDGTYTVLEIKAPTGYKIPDTGKEFEFTLDADTTNGQDGTGVDETGTALKSLKLNDETGEINVAEASDNYGIVDAQITNTSSSTLPSTGGIGTTLFYVIGGTLAAGAGVSLIAKKRMKNEE